jgi:hypothetical protein
VDSTAHHAHPIFTVYAGDYPEQVLMTLIKTGMCPVCPAAHQGIGELKSICPPQSSTRIRAALKKIDKGPVAFAKACQTAGIKPVQDPFWLDLPFVNVYKSITPDILHQLYQGIVKHVMSWINSACGEAEIDARCRRLPPSHHIVLYMKGISNCSRVTGQEHDQMCQFLLGLLIDIWLPDGLSNAPLVPFVACSTSYISPIIQSIPRKPWTSLTMPYAAFMTTKKSL